MGMRFRDQPEGLHRYVVERGSPADGATLRDLPMDEDVWISVVSRAGRMVQVRGGTALEVGDEVLALASDGALAADLFRRPG
jgi:cell volume regulation protein A